MLVIFRRLECGSNRIPLVIIILGDIAAFIKAFSDSFIELLFSCD